MRAKLIEVLIVAAALWAAVGVLCALSAPPAQIAYRFWTQAQLVDQAAAHASRVPAGTQQYVRYLDFHHVPPEQRALKIKTASGVINSLSRYELLAQVQEVPGTEGALGWFDLSRLRSPDDKVGLAKLVKAFEKLGEVGSGPAPIPEPYYHSIGAVVKARTSTFSRRKRGSKAVALGPHLNKATALGLAAITRTNFPIFEWHWFAFSAMVEPRYHELLGLDDSEASAKKLAAVDEKTADRVGAQVRGAALFSDVAHHNRVLERTPTVLRFGKGSYQESLDFKTSINLQDVLGDLLVEKADAKEIIFNLPNGMLGFFVVDGAGKRLDKADGDVANNRTSRFRDTQVRTAFHCMECHYKVSGWIEVDDEVREAAGKTITIASAAFEKTNKNRAKRVRQKYLDIDFNQLLRDDQALVITAVKAGTGGPQGLTPAEFARSLVDSIWVELERPVDTAQLALELGYPQGHVEKAMATTGLGQPFALMLTGRKARRDQVEVAFARLATLLYLKGSK